jgi:phosphoserine phosphatase
MVPQKLAGFDMDGTLLEEESSWATLHRHFKTTARGKRALTLYSEGRIGYEEFMRRDISSWPAGLNVEEVEDILSTYRIREEAPRTIRRLRARGFEIALVTAGIDLLARRVARDLGITVWLANGLKTDDKGILTGEGIGKVDPTRKEFAFNSLLQKLRVSKESTIAVGDSVFDYGFLKAAGKGFLLSQQLSDFDSKIIRIDKLTDIFQHLQQF